MSLRNRLKIAFRRIQAVKMADEGEPLRFSSMDDDAFARGLHEHLAGPSPAGRWYATINGKDTTPFSAFSDHLEETGRPLMATIFRAVLKQAREGRTGGEHSSEIFSSSAPIDEFTDFYQKPGWTFDIGASGGDRPIVYINHSLPEKDRVNHLGLFWYPDTNKEALWLRENQHALYDELEGGNSHHKMSRPAPLRFAAGDVEPFIQGLHEHIRKEGYPHNWGTDAKPWWNHVVGGPQGRGAVHPLHVFADLLEEQGAPTLASMFRDVQNDQGDEGSGSSVGSYDYGIASGTEPRWSVAVSGNYKPTVEVHHSGNGKSLRFWYIPKDFAFGDEAAWTQAHRLRDQVQEELDGLEKHGHPEQMSRRQRLKIKLQRAMVRMGDNEGMANELPLIAGAHQSAAEGGDGGKAPHLVLSDHLEATGRPIMASFVRAATPYSAWRPHARRATGHWIVRHDSGLTSLIHCGSGPKYHPLEGPSSLAYSISDPDEDWYHLLLREAHPDKYDSDPYDYGPKMSRGQPVRFLKPQAIQNVAGVLGGLHSENQVALAKTVSQVLKQMDLTPHKVAPVLHDLIHEIKPAIAAAIYKPMDPEAVNYASAWSGLLARQPAVLAFQSQENGPDSLYHMNLHGSGEQIHQALNQAGIGPRVLMPSEDGFEAIIYDHGRQQRGPVSMFARQVGTQVNESVGTGSVLGSNDGGEGRAAQRNVIRKVEGEPQRQSRGGAVRFAEVPVEEIHPDWKPQGIAPWMGRALQEIAADKETSGDAAGMAESILRTGDLSGLQPLHDALIEANHHHQNSFNWQYAPRGIAIDRLLARQAKRLLPRIRRLRAFQGGTLGQHYGPHRIAWHSYSHIRGGEGSGYKTFHSTLAALRQAIPDLTEQEFQDSLSRGMLHNTFNDPGKADSGAYENYMRAHNEKLDDHPTAYRFPEDANMDEQEGKQPEQMSRGQRLRLKLRRAIRFASHIPSNEELAGAHQQIAQHQGVSKYGVTYTMPNGLKYYAKRSNPPRGQEHELKVHDLAQRVGVSAPPIEIRQNVPGTEQIPRHRREDFYSVSPHINGRNLKTEEFEDPEHHLRHPEQLVNGHIFRYVIGDRDAHSDNWMLDKKGNIHSIDHEYAWREHTDPDDYHLGRSLPEETKIDPHFVQSILDNGHHFMEADPNGGVEHRLNVLKRFMKNGDYTQNGIIQAHEDYENEGHSDDDDESSQSSESNRRTSDR